MGLGNWLIGKLSAYLTREKPRKPSYFCDFDRICHEVKPADVLLIEGQNRISHIIQRVTLSPWSHSALYLGRLHDIDDVKTRELIHSFYQGPPGDQLLIESIVGKGTIISSIQDYKNEHVRLCRPDGLAYQDAQKVISEALKSIGKKYNIRHFFDLGRFLLASKLIPRRWKSSLFNYDPGQATQDICSAVIANAFIAINFPVLPLIRETQEKTLELIHRNPKLFTPSDFDYSPYFNIIKYPMFSTSEPIYRSLPWHNEYISNDEEGVSTSKPSKDK